MLSEFYVKYRRAIGGFLSLVVFFSANLSAADLTEADIRALARQSVQAFRIAQTVGPAVSEVSTSLMSEIVVREERAESLGAIRLADRFLTVFSGSTGTLSATLFGLAATTQVPGASDAFLGIAIGCGIASLGTGATACLSYWADVRNHRVHDRALITGYLDELKREGIALPLGSPIEQMLWWEAVSHLGAQDAPLVLTPAGVAQQIEIVRSALIGAIPDAPEHVVELLRELADDLPSSSSLSRRLRPQRWMMQSLMALYEVRERLGEMASELGESSVRALSANLQRQLLAAARSQSSGPERVVAFRTDNPVTRDMLAMEAAGRLWTPTVLEYFHRASDLITLKIVNSLILAPASEGRSGVFESSISMKLQSGETLWASVRWTAPTGDLQEALRSGRWADPISSAVETALSESPVVRSLLAVEACEAQMLPGTEEEELEVEAPVSRRGAR